MTIFTVILPLLYAVALPVAIWCEIACRCASAVGEYVMFIPMDCRVVGTEDFKEVAVILDD